MEQKPNFAIRVMVMHDGKILLGKSKEGKYAFPGGHLRYMESFEDCAMREVNEECGVEIEDVRYPSVVNVIEEESLNHNIHITLLADFKGGELKVLEPEKYESWDWYDVDNLPEPLYKNCELSIKSYKEGKNYFDIKDIS